MRDNNDRLEGCQAQVACSWACWGHRHTHKTQVAVPGKSRHPKCLEHVYDFPGHYYYANKKLWHSPPPMFMAALFTIAKTWKQPKCPSTDEWIKKRWYIYTMEYYSAIKRMK